MISSSGTPIQVAAAQGEIFGKIATPRPDRKFRISTVDIQTAVKMRVGLFLPYFIQRLKA